MLTLLSLAVRIQWEALGPVRPRGLCRPQVARPRPSCTLLSPPCARGGTFPVSVTSQDGGEGRPGPHM